MKILLFALILSSCALAKDDWVVSLSNRIETIDRNTPGNLGVYIRDMEDGKTYRYGSERMWYLSSTVKVPIAIALLEMVEAGKVSLDDKLTLEESDFVDGAGDLLWMTPGTQYSVERLLNLMLIKSDNTASDMLIRLVGEEELNRWIEQRVAPEGFGRFTTLLDVRHEAYSEIHPNARLLTNKDFIELHSEMQREKRYSSFINKLGLRENEVNARDIPEAFERYYTQNLNSGTLDAFGLLLEQLANGELLSGEHTELLLGIMEKIETGDRRIKAGLPAGLSFAQKTGTQVERACNVGIIEPRAEHPLIITVCLVQFGNISNAEQAFQQIGEAVVEFGLHNRQR